MSGNINQFDIVMVNFHNAQFTLCKEAIVKHQPFNAGDAWHFEDLETKQLHIVSEPCTITLLRRNGEQA